MLGVEIVTLDPTIGMTLPRESTISNSSRMVADGYNNYNKQVLTSSISYS